MYDSSFKKFQHESRIHLSEEAFNLGMNYTDSPIEVGKSKMLLNFDIADDATSLKPRAGIRTTAVAALPTTVTSDLVNMLPNFDSVSISATGEYGYKGITYKYVLLHCATNNKLYLCTIAQDIAVDTIKDIKTEGIEIIDTGLTGKVNDFSNTEIHNLKIKTNTPLAKKQIGVKAWSDWYFFFATEGSTTNLYNIKFNESTKRFFVNKVVPTTLTALEASPNKFNMLLSSPYSFSNKIVAGAFVLQGILCYSGGSLVVSPKINTKYNYKLAFTAPASTRYQITWEWKDYNGTTWTEVKKQTVTTASSGTPADITCDFAAPIKESLMRVTVTGYTTVTENITDETGAVTGTTTKYVLKSYPDQVMAVSINCDAEAQQSSANADLKNYDLSKATGMGYWQNRLVLWGFDDPIMFVSDTNLPEWFPYPNNTDLFDEPIIHCEPYLDYLLVFTTRKLYQLTMLSDGSGWSKTCIQDHLNLTKYDTNFIKTIKNMVFFKSGNSYYMVVPSSASNTGGLTIAPISKPIQWLLDNFEASVKDTLSDVYNYSDKLNLEYCFNYINNTDVVTNYVFEDAQGMLLNFCLLYNTEDRTWRTHLFDSQSIYTMSKLDATTDGTLVTLTPISQKLKYTNTEDNTTIINNYNTFIIQYLTRDNNNPRDLYIARGFKKYPDVGLGDGSDDVQILFDSVHKYLNHQFLDTGYRSLNYPNNKKRHREFQLRFNNKSEKPLKFGTTFYIDGENRKSMTKYQIVHETNKDADNYGVISVVPTLETAIEIQGTTILGELENDINAWQLDVSSFPHIPLIKARVAVSGKGYNNRLKLLSVNEENYEILGVCWVYKNMNLR